MGFRFISGFAAFGLAFAAVSSAHAASVDASVQAESPGGAASEAANDVAGDKAAKPHRPATLPGTASVKMPNTSVDEWMGAHQHGPLSDATEKTAITVPDSGSAADSGGAVKPSKKASATTAMASASLAVASPSTNTAPTTIADMARALKNDPDLIYEFVRDNIEIYPIFGIHKGARGALLDGAGTNFDQIDLFVQLVRASGYTANYVEGVIDLTRAQVQDFYGMPTDNGCRVQQFFDNGQIPVTVTVNSPSGCDGPLVSVRLVHLWARVTLPSGTFDFDPSLKSHKTIPGIDLVAATGYNRANLLSAALNGASVTADSIQGINRNAVRAQLDQLSNNLAAHIRQNEPAAGLNEVIGGREIIHEDACFPDYDYQCNGPLRRTRLPYQNTSYSTTTYTGSLPGNFHVFLRVTFAGASPLIVADSLYGRRLTISPNANLEPELRADGTLIATGSALPAGTDTDLTLEVYHQAYASTFANQGRTTELKSGETQDIVVGFGPVSSRLVKQFRDQSVSAVDAGLDPSSEPRLGASLATLGAEWLSQQSAMLNLLTRVSGAEIIEHHQIGIAGNREAPFFDLGQIRVSNFDKAGDPDRERGEFMAMGIAGSGFESGVLEQVLGLSSDSTVSLLDKAAVDGQTIYKATSANYAAIEPSLVNCDTHKSAFSSYINAGYSVVVPKDCAITDNQWSGVGYFAAYADSGTYELGALIDGGYLGGYPSVRLLPDDWTVDSYRRDRNRPRRNLKHRGDPIEMATGAFDYSHDDLSVGTGSFPQELVFRKSYSSALRTADSSLGHGWTHNFDNRLTEESLPLQGLGEDSPIDAATSIIHLLVGADLLSDPAMPAANLLTQAISANWFADHLQNNTEVLSGDGPVQIFTRLPDGTFNAPPSSSSILTQSADGSFVLTTARKEQMTFGSDGLATAWTSPNGLALHFAYADGKLSGVSNSLGRSLSISYLGNYISSVSDGNGRSVSYSYDSSGNLATYTDAASQVTTFQYDVPGRLTRFYLPANPTVAQVDNTYDDLGRVMQQVDADGNNWSYYIGGTRSEEVTPMGRRRIDYFGSNGETLATYEDMLASGQFVNEARTDLKARYNTYDGRGRLALYESNFEPTVAYTYDDTSCAGTARRCSQNVRQETHRAVRRGGAPPTLPDEIWSYTYEPQLNQIATSTNPKGAVTNFSYDPTTGNLLSVILPAPATGALRPETDYSYSSFAGAAGFPSFSLATQTIEKIDSTHTRITTFAYNSANHWVPSATNQDATGLNLTTSFVYDPVGNLLNIDGSRTDVADVTTFTYDSERRLTSTQDALGKLKHLRHDADGDVTGVAAQINAAWLNTCQVLTPSGKVSQEVGPAEAADSTSCPANDGTVPAIDNAYDGEGHLAQHTVNRLAAEGGSETTGYFYSPSGMLVRQDSGVGTALEQITYGTDHTYGDWKGFTNPVDPIVEVRYDMPLTNGARSRNFDGHGRLETYLIDWPLSGSNHAEYYNYDLANNLTSITLPDAKLVQLTYDGLNRLSTFSPAETSGNVTYSYDALGHVLGATAGRGGATVSFTYDALGRLLSETSPLGAVSYQYNQAGQKARITWPDGFYVTYTYDALGRMTAIRENGTTLLASFTYDDLSRRTLTSYGNGTSISYGYDTKNRLSSLGIDLAGTTSDVSWTYGYDQAGELTSATSSNGSYDWNGHYNVNRTYQNDGADVYTYSGTNALQYDGRGNLTSDGTWTFGYDSQNRLVSAVVSHGPQASYTYDAVGRLYSRIPSSSKNAVRYLYAGQQLVGEYNASGGLIRRYVPGASTDEVVVLYEGTNGATKTWLYGDRQGSTVATANSSGSLTAAYSYGPFGEPNVTTGSPLRYNGRPLDPDTGLYYYRARWYSPYFGRFLSPDPAGIADGLPLYRYVGNDPINFKDPLGLSRQNSHPGRTLREFGWGLADGATFGLTADVRRWFGGDVDTNSLGYRVANVEAALGMVAVTGGVGEPLAAENAGVDLALTYKPGWTAAQRAEADLKVRLLTASDTVVTPATRSGTSAASRYRSAGNEIPAGSDIDHAVDLQLGGADVVSNMWPLDSSVNRSLGAQIQNQISNLPPSTVINKVTIGPR